MMKYGLLLVNTSADEVTVLTKGLYQTLSEDLNSNAINIQFGLTTSFKTEDSIPIIPSLVNYGPVTLRKDEAATISLKHFPGGNPFNDLPADGVLTVTYSVSERWGKRFGLWHGAVTTKRFQLKGGAISPDDSKR
jgi:hypothetical protein